MPDRPGPVLITGANSGIGLSTALRLASRGWDTWGTVRTATKGNDLAAEARKEGVGARVHPLVLDISDHDAIVAAWPELPDFYAVVNNAGYSEMGAIEEVSAADAKAQLDVNLVAPAVVSSCALPAMRARGAGRIVMVSSMFGKAAVMPLNGWYHASKFGLEALSDVLRMEVAGFGIKVSIVERGFFRTGIDARPAERSKELAARKDSPYREAYERAADGFGVAGRFAQPVSIVARTITSAIESRRPLRRYLVGVDAVAVTAAERLMPRDLTDRMARMMTGLTSTSGAPKRRAR
jgi:NAD(P)-dependent dehydrogenase (short-subunit alcohol dehydrogenase family)